MAESSAFVPSRTALERMLSGVSGPEAVLLLHQILRGSGATVAVAACEVARDLGHADPGVVLTEVMARAAAGEVKAAMALVEGVLAAAPGNLQALHLKAHLSVALGDPTTGCDLLRRVVAVSPDFPGAQAALAALLFPGPYYRDVLARIHSRLRPETYLEIGVETGATLALAGGSRVAVGVDPDPSRVEVRLPPVARTYAMTSDAFFAGETRETAFGGRGVALTFIDGMHWFEYTLRDFANAERWSAADGTIVLHDCLPVTEVAARRERVSGFWVGDTWKVLECLLDVRPDLRIRVVPARPSGLAVVRGLDPNSMVLADCMDALVQRHADAVYPHEPGRWPARYGIVSNDEAGLAEALGS